MTEPQPLDSPVPFGRMRAIFYESAKQITPARPTEAMSLPLIRQPSIIETKVSRNRSSQSGILQLR
jgi:hypothetical protein